MRPLSIASLLSAILFVTTPLTALRADEKDNESSSSDRVSYAEIELKGNYHEGAQATGLFGQLSETLDTAIARLDKAGADEKIAGVILRINGPTLGWAKMHDFRKAIGRIQ